MRATAGERVELQVFALVYGFKGASQGAIKEQSDPEADVPASGRLGR